MVDNDADSAKAEVECWAWLQQLAKDHPDRQPNPKPKLWREAKARWPQLSKRAFNRGWCNIVKERLDWKRPGRQKRLIPAP
jgi:hypothetical protein